MCFLSLWDGLLVLNLKQIWLDYGLYEKPEDYQGYYNTEGIMNASTELINQSIQMLLR